MASILDRYGIKEVADVTFYTIDETTGGPLAPVLYLDSLKVSTIEQTAETVYAQGGKGNPRLIGWDFGKEITLSLEDALFSPKSMAIMFGDGKVYDATSIKKTITFVCKKDDEENVIAPKWSDAKGNEHTVDLDAATITDANGSKATNLEAGVKYFATFDVAIDGQRIEIGPNTFPETYYITGDTYARSEVDGTDDYFQFIVYKGKVTSENTITMEAEGDPSVFNMNVDVLRATIDGKQKMMELIKYDLT